MRLCSVVDPKAHQTLMALQWRTYDFPGRVHYPSLIILSLPFPPLHIASHTLSLIVSGLDGVNLSEKVQFNVLILIFIPFVHLIANYAFLIEFKLAPNPLSRWTIFKRRKF